MQSNTASVPRSEELAQKMEKKQKFIAQKAKVYNIRSFPIFPIPISEY